MSNKPLILLWAVALLLFTSPITARAQASQPQIDNARGKRLLLCGGANIADTNARLENDPEDFLKADSKPIDQLFAVDWFPGAPQTYWGINTSTDAYMCLELNYHSDSLTDSLHYYRKGSYSEFAITVNGHKLGDDGNPLDLDNDGEEDWISLRYLQVFAGLDLIGDPSPADSQLITDFYRATYGVRGAPGTVFLSDQDANNYMRRMTVKVGGQGYVEGAISLNNPNEGCTNPSNQVWEECWIWTQLTGFSGDIFDVSTEPDSKMIPSRFFHNNNKWVKYDDSVDTFIVQNPELGLFLDSVKFEPKFWVLSKNSEIDYY